MKISLVMKRSMVCFVLLCILFGLIGCSKRKSETSTGGSTETSMDVSMKASTDVPTEGRSNYEYTQENKNGTIIFEDSIGYDSVTETATAEYESGALEFNTEEYNAISENGYKSTKNYPISTLSADVDTASYANVRRMLTNGEYVVPDAVRIEEMINYFDYKYERPEGEHPFSITAEIADCPWNPDTKLMLVGLKTKEIDFSESVNSNLVFLIDVSGSMYSEDKLPLVQKAFSMLLENLTEKDRISIVTYAGSDTVVLKGASGDQKLLIQDAINNLEAGGATAGSKGIETAYQLAEANFITGGNNRIILATDGDLNVGITSEGELEDLITEKKKNGVYLSVLGFGTGNYKDNKLEALADNGNGNYSYIDSVNEAKKVLVEEMGANFVTVADDVKFQLEFNPAQIKGYRLIGYENRLLHTEDFEDDTKDAGEVGAGHTVTVLYELVLKDSKLDIPETDLKYQSNTPTHGQEEYLTINIRYKKPGESTSILMSKSIDERNYKQKSSSNLKFAAAVAQFGMLLRDSEYKGSASYDGILNQLNSEDYSEDEYRKEFLILVRQASLNEYYNNR